MECRLAGETEVLGENLPQRHFCPSQNPTWPDPVQQHLSAERKLCQRIENHELSFYTGDGNEDKYTGTYNW
jgi:hypothetical protein